MANRQVDVKLVVYVKGQLTERGDVRELEPVVQAVVNGAAAGKSARSMMLKRSVSFGGSDV